MSLAEVCVCIDYCVTVLIIDVLAGTYATVGARLFRPHGDSTKVGYVVHAGSDFPSNVRGEIDSWSSATAIVPTPERLTTRGKNIYRNGLRGRNFSGSPQFDC